jgi:hypothetical protein
MFDVLARLHAKSMAGSSSTMSARPIPRGIRNLPKPSHSQSVTARKVLTACAPSWRDAMPAFSPRISGLPCYLLETLASGRPVGAIELPQFAP